MKILFVSNLYPPHYLGGYEVHCARVVDALREAGGWELCVLTSTYGLPPGPSGRPRPIRDEVNGVPVLRQLHQYAAGPQPSLRPWTLFQARRELHDARQFVSVLDSFRPDVVSWWNMMWFSKTLLPIVHARGIPDVHYIDDLWMIQEYGPAGEPAAAFWAGLWEGQWGPTAARPILRRLGRWWEARVAAEGLPTRRFPNQPRHVCFLSEYLRTLHRAAGMDFPSSEVIHGGVPAGPFHAPVRDRALGSGPLRVLYAGQVTPDRGVHTVVEALAGMDPATRNGLTLGIAGGGRPEYVEQVKRQVAAAGLNGRVSFLGKTAHAQMADVYKRHDILIFASTRPEGLGFTAVEALLAGCAVVTTGSGGAGEIAAIADLPLFPGGRRRVAGRSDPAGRQQAGSSAYRRSRAGGGPARV